MISANPIYINIIYINKIIQDRKMKSYTLTLYII